MAFQLLFSWLLVPGFIHVPYYWCYCLAFTQSISFATIWCIYTVVLRQPQLGRNPVSFFLTEGSDFHMSITVYAFIMSMLTTLLVDEILLPRYMRKKTLRFMADAEYSLRSFGISRM